MRACVDTTGVIFGPDQITTQVARRRDPALRLLVHRDIAVRTVRRAEATADAVVFDHDLDRAGMIFPRLAMDRIDGTAHETVGIEARAAGTGDEEVLEPEPFADQPRDTLVRVGTGPRALVAPRAALQVEHEQFLGAVKAVLQETPQFAGGLGLRLDVALQQPSRLRHQPFPHHRKRRENLLEVVSLDLDQLHVVECRAGRGPKALGQPLCCDVRSQGDVGHGRNQSDLAECPARSQVVEHPILPPHPLRDFHETDANLEEVDRRVSLPKDRLPLVNLDQLGSPLQHAGGDHPIGLRQAAKHRELRDLTLQRVRPVGIVEDRAGGLVPLQHMEHVLADLEQLRVFDRHDRGRPRIVVQAAHDSEDHVGRRHLVDPSAVGEREWSAAIDVHLFVLRQPLAASRTGGALQPVRGRPHEGLQRPLAPGSVTVAAHRHTHPALNDEERGRSVLPLAADDVSRPIDVAADRVAVPLKELEGNAGEDRMRFEFLGRQRGALSHVVVVCNPLVENERARRAVDHAFAAGHTARLPHRIVEVKADVGGIALATAADDVVFLDVGAGPDAAIAEDALVVVDVDS